MPTISPRRLLNSKQMAEATGVSSQTLDSWRKQGIIPCIRIRHVIRFDPDRVLRALQKREIKEVV